MNDLSLAFLALFGLLFGFVFRDLLKQFGAKDELASSYVAVILLPFMIVVSFVFIRLFMFAQLELSDFQNINSFASSPMLWVAVATLVSGAARFVLDKTVFAKVKK